MYGQVFDAKRDGVYVSTVLGWRKKLKIRRYIGDVDVWDVHRIADYFDTYDYYE
jgi:hypothetical protein